MVERAGGMVRKPDTAAHRAVRESSVLHCGEEVRCGVERQLELPLHGRGGLYGAVAETAVSLGTSSRDRGRRGGRRGGSGSGEGKQDPWLDDWTGKRGRECGRLIDPAQLRRYFSLLLALALLELSTQLRNELLRLGQGGQGDGQLGANGLVVKVRGGGRAARAHDG